MSAVISLAQNAGDIYGGYSQEVAKNISYFLPIDSATASKLTNPFTLPISGNIYSYEIYLRCRCDLAPENFCSNFKVWYNSGLPINGQKITVNNDIINTYTAPKNIESVRGTRDEFINYTDVDNSISLDGDLINVGDYTSWLVFQLELSAGADTGSFELEYTIQYDEV